ncbi:MAG: mechanosensitive ion channel family protein [Candidatus Micrarchaeota archaeon]
MDLPYQAFSVLELMLAIGASFFLGRIAYEIFFRVAKAFTSRTRVTLDDRLVAACEQPLEIGSVVLFTYVLSGYMSRITGVGDLIARYSLALGILLAAFLASSLVGAFLRWYYDEGVKRHSRALDVSLLPFVRKVSKVVILFIGITLALGTVGLDLTGIFAVTSIAALILGLASQETLANFFAGMALQLDRQVRYGDYFRFVGGDVVRLGKIGIRSSQFTDLDGNDVVLSNSEFARQRVTIMGEKGKPAKIGAGADIPLAEKPDDLQEFVKDKLKKDAPEWLADPQVSVSVDKIREKTAEVSVVLTVTDLSRAPEARAYVNRAVWEYLHRRRTK